MYRIYRGRERGSEPIPLTRRGLSEEDIRALDEFVRSEECGAGRACERLEARLCEFTGRAHAIATSSGASALELALLALGADQPGRGQGRVTLVPAAGFPAGLSALARTRSAVRAVDLDPATWVLDVDAAERALASSADAAPTFAVLAEDRNGVVPELGVVAAMCASVGAHLIEDASGALGGFAASGVAATAGGEVVVLELLERDGGPASAGAVLCERAELAERVRTMGDLGRARGASEVSIPGMDARPSELAAVLALARLERVHAEANERRLLRAGYEERLAGLCARGVLRWQAAGPEARPAWSGFAILLAENLPPGRERERVRAQLAERGIHSEPAALAAHRMAGFAHLPGIAGRAFPVAQALHERGLSLPLFCGMRSAELDRVCDALSEALS